MLIFIAFAGQQLVQRTTTKHQNRNGERFGDAELTLGSFQCMCAMRGMF